MMTTAEKLHVQEFDLDEWTARYGTIQQTEEEEREEAAISRRLALSAEAKANAAFYAGDTADVRF